MKRRKLLTLGAGLAASILTGLRPAVADLEPDGQWLIYRRYSLLIVGQRDNEIAGTYAGAIVDVLARFLPASRASWPAQLTSGVSVYSLPRTSRTSH